MSTALEVTTWLAATCSGSLFVDVVKLTPLQHGSTGILVVADAAPARPSAGNNPHVRLMSHRSDVGGTPGGPLFQLPKPVPGGLSAIAARRGGAVSPSARHPRASCGCFTVTSCMEFRIGRCVRPQRACVLAAVVACALAVIVFASRAVGGDRSDSSGGARGGVSGLVVDSVNAIQANDDRIDPSSFAAHILRMSAPPAPPSPRAIRRAPTRAPLSHPGARRLDLFFAWIGSAAPPYAQLQRILLDVVGQTAASVVELYLMVEDTTVAEADAELMQHLAVVAAKGSARRTTFSWTLISFVKFRDSSTYYSHLCTDFQANIFHANAKEYACQFLVKPLLWEIIPPDVSPPKQHLVVALDTDMRIAGDLLDLLDEHAVRMAERSSIMALSPEQQPTYAFNSPDAVRGFNGGVQLIDVVAMSTSSRYHELLAKFTWSLTDPRWRPATDLGDQTLYSIFNYSDPILFVEMGCRWNRQLCRGWFSVFAERTPRNFLYQHELDALCLVHPHDIRILHGNCRSQRPGSDELDGLPDTWQDRNAAAEAELEETFRRVYAAEIEASGGLTVASSSPRPGATHPT